MLFYRPIHVCIFEVHFVWWTFVYKINNGFMTENEMNVCILGETLRKMSPGSACRWCRNPGISCRGTWSRLIPGWKEEARSVHGMGVSRLTQTQHTHTHTHTHSHIHTHHSDGATLHAGDGAYTYIHYK